MRLAAFTASLALAISALAMPPVPRKSPEFTIVEPSGKQTLLSSLKGKVVVIEFLSTTCPHCQQASMMFSRLYKELGPRGFQPLGVAFNTGVTPAMVTGFVQAVLAPRNAARTTAAAVMPRPSTIFPSGLAGDGADLTSLPPRDSSSPRKSVLARSSASILR